MPSATTKRRSSGSMRKLSSLWFRFMPTCVSPWTSSLIGVGERGGELSNSSFSGQRFEDLGQLELVALAGPTGHDCTRRKLEHGMGSEVDVRRTPGRQ